jgi:sulfide:quinone oxidoreductase
MSKVLILGGGFGGVTAAECLADQLGEDHQITLVSRSRRFVFYPALVRLAFGRCRPEDIWFDLRHAMLDRRVNFIEAEVARIDPDERRVTIAHGEVEGALPYDYLIFALGRRLATERITGFYEHAHHLLNIDKAIQFGKAIASLHEGRAIIGHCAGARLPVPVYETAFALSRALQERGERDRVKITVVSPGDLEAEVGNEAATALTRAFAARQIEHLQNFAVETVTENKVTANNKQAENFNLLMLLPPFRGSSVSSTLGVTDPEGYIHVNSAMRVPGHERIYAVGDCADFDGPKMGHMATRQGEVAALNLAAEIDGREPVARYQHEMRVVIDEAGGGSIYLRQDLSNDGSATLRHGRFWSWAKRLQEHYWEASHS